ncbi:adenylate/guanylate cyclase [Candidatus Vecturithrix granuli]|uniref:Adenylate/guanylate cyclase n=1 Tax=Vecturithrix granuli TaxID=1499967 RepID=A0A081CAY7_VECG1|nr:adenylate/guanylate cyclase [Candidatus Vecturithrix granuli]
MEQTSDNVAVVNVPSKRNKMDLVAQFWEAADRPLVKEQRSETSSSQDDSTALTPYALPGFMLAEMMNSERIPSLEVVSNLLTLLGTERKVNDVLQAVVEQLVHAIPGATRGALVLYDGLNGTLLLQAYISANGPSVDKTLVQQVITEQKGLIWQSPEEKEEDDQNSRSIEAAMYAPLLWQDHVLGVICVDTPHPGTRFIAEDLQFLSAVAQCLAMAMMNQQLQETLREKAKLLERVLASFSPKVGQKLIERSRHGKLRPGGKKSEVTILYVDIRGFTRMSTGRDAEDVVDILNAYFSPLMKAIFHYDGIIDKFVGDAILAVFGSPESDANQYRKAIQAAWEMQAAVQALNTDRNARGQVTCDIGIGIHCGEVLHGFIGAAEQVEFTVIGDAVNRASRYCDGANAGEVLISPEVYQRVWEIVKEERTAIQTKHEGAFLAYRIKEVYLKS